MNADIRQQIVISGLGGQGVLFVTRLLAEAAMDMGLPVFTAETHGMAQRGGTVLSHLKVGGFASPLIRPGQADGLIALKAETLDQHAAYLQADGWAVVNHGGGSVPAPHAGIDADAVAVRLKNPRAVNLVMLGYALGTGRLFCTRDAIDTVIGRRLEKKPDMLAAALSAMENGVAAA